MCEFVSETIKVSKIQFGLELMILDREVMQPLGEKGFASLREHELYAKLKKCDFYKDKIQYFGHVISKEGIFVNLDKMKAITKWNVPKDVTNIRSFMVIIVYYRRFIKGFSKVAYSITSLQNKGIKFNWTKKCQESFNKLKHLLTTSPIQ
jgi:hypothetical protein